MAKKPQGPEQQIIDAAFDIAVERGWNRVTLADVALRAKVPLADVGASYPSKAAILNAYLDRLDRQMLAGESEVEVDTRDRLFDVVMRRLEAMNPHKEALRVILRDSGADPVAALCGAGRFLRTVGLMLEAAGIATSGLGGLARIDGMAAIYLYTLRTWLNDDTPDMANTLAALDKALRRGEALASMIWRGRRRPPRSAPPERQNA